METGLLKKYVKQDYKIIGALFVGTCFFQLVMNYLSSLGAGFNLSAVDLGAVIFWVYNALFFFGIFAFLPTIFTPLLKKEEADVWNTMPMKRDKYFNTLIIRYMLDVILPITVLGIILLLIPKDAYNDYLIGLDGVTTYYVVNNISSTLLSAFSVIFFIVISGNIGNVICNYIAFMSLLGFVTFMFTDQSMTYVDGMYVYNGGDALKFASSGMQFVIAGVLFFVSRYLYKIREVENIGKMFTFKNLDIAFSTLYSSVFVAWLTVVMIDTGYNSVVGFLVGLLILIVAYTVLLSLFNLDIKIIKTKYKTLVYPLAVFVVLVPVGSFVLL